MTLVKPESSVGRASSGENVHRSPRLHSRRYSVCSYWQWCSYQQQCNQLVDDIIKMYVLTFNWKDSLKLSPVQDNIRLRARLLGLSSRPLSWRRSHRVLSLMPRSHFRTSKYKKQGLGASES
jgi:hypothetical protein